MVGFIQGLDRHQSVQFPARLEEYISTENPVRVVDAYIESLDLPTLGFDCSEPGPLGAPRYHPATLLKLYVYGYLNRINSSRRLEAECQRNVEVMWLTGKLMPCYKTIAAFRKDNREALQGVCTEFVGVCRRLKLIDGGVVAIDGSKFKAVNNRDRNYTQAKLKRRLEQVSKSVERYLLELERADRDEPQVREAKQQRLSEKLEKLEQEQQRLGRIEEMLKKEPDQQLSFTDPDARSMATSGKGTGVVGYNVQLAVEAEHHLIVSHEVTNVGHDRGQMLTMATQAQAATGVDALEAVLDRGYYKGEEIVACEQAGIRVYLPKPKTSNNQAKGLYGKQDFRYIVEDDEYECPAGQRLIWRMKTQERGQVLHRYWYSGCQNCALKAKCTPSAQRRVTRWEHEGILEAVQRRLDLAPEAMRLRRQTVEHPFGTIKGWMGATHFLTKRLPGVRAEMSLQVLAYNLKRVINLLGVSALIEAITA